MFLPVLRHVSRRRCTVRSTRGCGAVRVVVFVIALLQRRTLVLVEHQSDVVTIAECRPLSKTKSFVVVEVEKR